MLVKLWRHSSKGPIHRLATCARLPGDRDNAEGPHAFVAAGNNEVAVSNLSTGGPCRRCFRALPPAGRDVASNVTLPFLHEEPIPSHPFAPILTSSQQMAMLSDMHLTTPTPDVSMRAIMGRISIQSNNSYVITGSTDKNIRFWDFNSPSRCYTVSGLQPGQPRPAYDAIPVPDASLHTEGMPSVQYGARGGATTDGGSGHDTRLFVCYDAEVPSVESVVPSHLPMREQRGIQSPPTSHHDAVLDLKSVGLPTKMMLSSSRDGVVKVWR